MRPFHIFLIITALLILGVFPSTAVFLGDLLGMAGGVAVRGALAVLEQPSVQVLAGIGIVVRLTRRRAA